MLRSRHGHAHTVVSGLRWLCLFVLGLAGLGAFRPPALEAASADCNIHWNEVRHDTFALDDRSPGGATTPGTDVRLRLRVAQGDLTSARVRVWNDRTNTETYVDLAWDGAYDDDPVTYDWWTATLAGSTFLTQTTLLYYFFELNDAGDPPCGTPDQDFYVDDDPAFTGGGLGSMSDGFNDSRSFQITVYDPAFSVPAWMQRAIVYQVFPDRFRDGNPGNNPAAGRFFYGTPGGAISRSNQAHWNATLCDPRSTYTPACAEGYSHNFYGGDLAGLTEKVNAGYFDNLGVTALYLNPIFSSPSNHKYDTSDYLTIAPDFGTLADFQALAAAAEAHGLRLILDGVFNHVSSDSTYFDYYSRYNSAGALTSPNGPGTDDNSGACEGNVSPYYGWFYFGVTQPNAGGTCANGAGDALQEYQAWFGYASLPKLQATHAGVVNLILGNGLASVGPYWTAAGASGWRFDVGADVDPGLTSDPANTYWEDFRAAVRAVDPETLTLGEEWGDASAWLLGEEWDSVMNYRFRSAVLSWLFTGCAGNGCESEDTPGEYFEDNDSNTNSSSGALGYLSPSQFNARLRSIEEDYPPMAWKAMLNLAGSHDTNRLRFLLRKINNDSEAAAVQRMKEFWLFAFTYAGAPTLYYGDEIGLNHDAVWANNKWEDDPYNRAPYPWPDTTGGAYGYGSGNDTHAAAANLLDHARVMASLRLSYRALQDGDVQHGLVIDDAQQLYGFARTGDQTALVALNRSGAPHSAVFSGLNAAPFHLSNGTVLLDALNGLTYTVSSGVVTATVNASWGAVLLEHDEIETPAAPAGLVVSWAAGDVTLSWGSVVTDTLGGRELATTYQVHRGFTPGFVPTGATLLEAVRPNLYGLPDGRQMFTDTSPLVRAYYQVIACNAAGVCSAPALAAAGAYRLYFPVSRR